MDVKEFSIGGLPKSPMGSGMQRKLNSIPSVKPPVATETSVKVNVSEAPESDVRTKLNDVIAVVNVTSEATGSIRKMVESIEGIVKQVSDSPQPDNRVSVLEGEANQLVDAIKDIAVKTSVGDVRPLAGDNVLLEVKEELGRQLSIIFPDDAKDAFGIGLISFSRKDAILDTKAKIELAWRKIEQLTSAVQDNASLLKEVAGKVEVAMQNSKAAEASPRDLEEAVKLAEKTSQGIGSDPEQALRSIRQFPNKVTDLLS